MLCSGRNAELPLDISARSTCRIDERGVAARIQLEIERGAGNRRAERLQCWCEMPRRRPHVGDLEGLGLVHVRSGNEPDAGRIREQPVSVGFRVAVGVVDGQRYLDRFQCIDEPRALLARRRVQIGRRTHDDLLDQSRRGICAPVGAPVGLNHQRGLARSQRR